MTSKRETCRWCGAYHGPRCPEVKAFEYHPDGTLKRIEFITYADYLPNKMLEANTTPPWETT